MEPLPTSLLEQLGDVATVRWTPELRAIAKTAPIILVELEVLGRVRARLLREEERRVRLRPGEQGLSTYRMTLVSVDGETEPRWIAAERVVLSPVALVMEEEGGPRELRE